MKIFRADLEVGLKDKLFDISSESLKLDEVRFSEKTFPCTIHSDAASHGYYLKGNMDVSTLEECDRCLSEFSSDRNINFSILLTSDSKLVNNDEHDIIFFTEQDDSVDISPVLAEYIQLDRPLKELCSDECKGLCPSCGCNLNEKDCLCTNDTADPRWDILKKIN